MLTPLTSTPSLARMRMYRVPSDHAGLHQVAALRVDVDGDVGSADLQLLGVHQIAGAQAGLRAEGLVILGLKGIHMGGGHAAGGQDGPHLPLGEQEGLLLLAGLVLFDHVPQLAVDGLDHVIAAILRQRLPQEGLKGLLLDGGRHGRRGAEQGVNELRVVLPDVPGVVEGIIEVGGALVKGGEEEACLRRRDDPVRLQVVEGIFIDKVAQGGLGQLHRADGAQDVGEHLVGGVVHPLPVFGPVGDVIGVVGQEDEIVPLQGEGGDDPLEQGLHGLFVRQGGAPQGHEEPVLVAVHHLLSGEGEVDEVFGRGCRTGSGLRMAGIFPTLLGHEGQGRIKLRDVSLLFVT